MYGVYKCYRLPYEMAHRREVITDDYGDEDAYEEEPREVLIKQIVNYGIAGPLSYGFWEAAFWVIGGAGAYGAYIISTGHFPDL